MEKKKHSQWEYRNSSRSTWILDHFFRSGKLTNLFFLKTANIIKFLLVGIVCYNAEKNDGINRSRNVR